MLQCRFYILILALAFCCVSPSFGQSKDVLQQKKAKIQAEIELTNKLLQQANKEKNQSVNVLSTLNKQIQSRDEIIKTLDLELKMTTAQITQLQSEIQLTEHSIEEQKNLLDTLKKEYALMIQHAYYNRNAYHRLAFIFSSQSYNQAFKRLRYLQEYSRFRQKQAQ